MDIEERREQRSQMRYRRQRSRLQHIIIVLMAVLAVVIVAALVTNRSGTDDDRTVTKGDVTMELLGSSVVIAECGQDPVLPDVRVLYKGERVEAAVTVDEPDMTQPGEYTVTFTAKYRMKTLMLTCTVRMLDTTAPQITLVTDPDYTLEYGEPYKEEGFTAYDIVDGDLTDRVESRVEGDKVYYTVTDSAGNTATAQRVIHYVDTVAPELTLLGADDMTLDYAAEFTDPGASAYDSVDGDLSVAVAVAGKVNVYVAGTYTLTYSVSDAAGNTSSVTRTVTVNPAPIAEPEKVIYLTFDDGPGKYTPELLAVLEKYDVKVTFFVVGTANLQYLDEIYAAGHSIGIHSDTHKYSDIYSGTSAFWADFNAVSQKIEAAIGTVPKICRFPGGSTSATGNGLTPGIMAQLRQQVTDQGYRFFDWNVDSGDASGAKTADEVYNNVIAGIGNKKVAVVLQHDIKQFSVEAVERIIQWGLANGYTFLGLDETSPKCSHAG